MEGLEELRTFAVAGPQLIQNHRQGHGFRLSGNRWKNVEMGLRLEPRERQDVHERVQRAQLHIFYMQSAATYDEREALAKERVLTYLRRKPTSFVVGTQLRKLVALILHTPSFFERALVERWGDPPPTWLSALRRPARWFWYGLLLLGLGGVVTGLRRGPGWLLLALFVAYFTAALLVIPYKMRFVMPLVPILCLFAGAAVQRSAAAVGRMRAGQENKRVSAGT